VIPRRVALAGLFNKLGFNKGESFINTNIGHNNRFNFFSLNNFALNAGISAYNRKNNKLSIRLFSEFNYLYNESDTFESILNTRPFLRYSYNTALVGGLALSYLSIFNPKNHPRSENIERYFKFDAELSLLPIATEINRKYAKINLEYKLNTKYKNRIDIAYRAFLGMGVPLFEETSLPFFKQFFAGGSNSMRGWAVRGIGLGGQKLTPLAQNNFNDRTGDVQFETNFEFRHNIARLIPNILFLKGAAFFDVGNVWNLKSSPLTTVDDLTIFKPDLFFKQLGLSAGYGLRFDISYLVIRADFSFRFKRPENSEVNNGWKCPDIGFDDAFRKIFAKEFREWRYENFNFTLGINYPF
jgi:outer membrane protein insertion porin family